MRPMIFLTAAALWGLAPAFADPGLHDLPMDVMDQNETPEQAMARMGGAKNDEESPFAIPPQTQRVWSTELRQFQFASPDLITGLPDSGHRRPGRDIAGPGGGRDHDNDDGDKESDRDDGDKERDRDRDRDEDERENHKERDRDRGNKERDRDDGDGD